MFGRLRRSAVSGAVLLALTAGTAACTGEEQVDPPEAAETTATPQARPNVPLKVQVGTVTGDLGKKRRIKVAREVGAVVNRWFRAAWLKGPYPRARFGLDAFPAFTDGARRTARGDRRLLTNAALGPRVDGVRARARRVTVDLFSPGGNPAGATARFRLVLDTESKADRRVRVTGSLLLGPGPAGNWRIFGYDVAREVTKHKKKGKKR